LYCNVVLVVGGARKVNCAVRRAAAGRRPTVVQSQSRSFCHRGTSGGGVLINSSGGRGGRAVVNVYYNMSARPVTLRSPPITPPNLLRRQHIISPNLLTYQHMNTTPHYPSPPKKKSYSVSHT